MSACHQSTSSWQPIAADGVLLELPTGWRNGARVLGKSDTLIMMQQWYQSAHGLRRLGGNTSRNPEYKFQYFTQAPLIGDLIALMNADRPHIAPVVASELDAMIERDKLVAPAVLDFLGIDYVTVHVEKSPPALLRFVQEALPLDLIDEWHGPDWTGTPSTIRLYRVRRDANRPTLPKTQYLGDELGNLYLGEGWSSLPTVDGVRLATRRNPVLLADLPSEGSVLTIDWTGPAKDLAVSINGHPVELGKPDANGKSSVRVPAGVADQPVDRLELHFEGDPEPATEVAAPADARAGPWAKRASFCRPQALSSSAAPAKRWATSPTFMSTATMWHAMSAATTLWLWTPPAACWRAWPSTR